MDEKRERLKKDLQEIYKEYPSKKDILGMIGVFKDAVSKFKEDVSRETEENVGELNQSISTALKRIESAEKTLIKEIKEKEKSIGNDLSDVVRQFNAEIKKIKADIPEMPDVESLESRLNKAISGIEKKIQTIPEIPKELSNEDVRDKLESLEGEARLDWTAVRGVIGIHVGTKPPEDKDMLWFEPNTLNQR